MGRGLILTIIIVVFGLIVSLSSVFRVWETEQVVVTKFGKPVRTVKEPGLHFRIPFIEKLRVFERRLLDYDAAPTEILTQDKKALIVDNYAKWRIIDPLRLLQAVQNEFGAQSRLGDIIYSELRVEVGRHAFHTIISEKRGEIMEVVTKKSDEKAREYGVEVVDVRIKRADLPQENERGEGDAEATRIYARAFNRNQKFYGLVRTLEAYEKAIDSTTTIILSPDADFFKYFWEAP